MKNEDVTVSAQMPDSEAQAILTFLKRATFTDYMRHAASHDEAWLMFYASEKLRDAIQASST